MKLIIISCVFPPEPAVSAKTSYDIAVEFASRGNIVTVIAPFPNRPGGKVYSGYKRRFFGREIITSKINLIRCFSFVSSSAKTISRFFENISFGLTSGLALLRLPKPDVVYSNTWPIFATGIIVAVTMIRRIPLVLNVQDLYPESIVSQKRISQKNILIKLLREYDGFIARHSKDVIVISDFFAQQYLSSRHVQAERLHIIPNWICTDNLKTIEPEVLAEFRIKKKIVTNNILFVYGGNIGFASGLDVVINAFVKLEENNHAVIMIAGEGSQLNDCRSMIQDAKQTHIIFHSPWLATETELVLQIAQVLIVPTRGNQSLVSVPSKLLSYWISARPVLAMALPGTDLANMVEISGGGWVIPPDQPDLLLHKIKEISKLDRNELIEMGRRGREFVLMNYSKSLCLPRVIDILERAASDE